MKKVITTPWFAIFGPALIGLGAAAFFYSFRIKRTVESPASN